MKHCTSCGVELNDEANVCPSCGAVQPAAAQAQPDNAQQAGAAPQGEPVGYQAYPGYQQPIYNEYDHTADFTAADISDNKVICMCIYLLGMVGIIIAMLASNSSPYVAFNVRQGLKLTITSTLVSILAVVLFFTIIVPAAAAICGCIIFVVRIMCFVYICQGKAIEAPIVRSFGFLR